MKAALVTVLPSGLAHLAGLRLPAGGVPRDQSPAGQGSEVEQLVWKRPIDMALQVKPTLQRLKGTLLGSGTALVLTAGVLFGLVTSGADADGMYGE